MTAPRFQSTKIPGLVMWPNGHIVRVEVDEKEWIIRDKNGPRVIASYGRVDLPGLEMREFGMSTEPEKRKTLDEKAFELVEQYEEQKRRDLEHRVRSTLSLLVVRRAKARALKRDKAEYRDPS